MQKYFRLTLIFIGLVWGANRASAQVTILDESLLTTTSFNNFTAASVTGAQTWSFSGTYGAVCNGYAGQSFENEDWLISPVINLFQTDNVKLTFSHTRGTASVLNVGVAQGWYKVFATADYTGNPATTTWTELTGLNQNVPTAWQFISSGELIVPEVAKSTNSRIAFRYMSSATQSATWEIRNVKVMGEPQATNPNAGVFKITNWNTEWFGCTTLGPTDETLQMNNVAAAMLSMNSDIFCLQEVSSASVIPTLVSLLGSSEWAGALVPAGAADCEQKQGIIYKKSRIQLVSSTLLSSGNAAQGNSYYYNWSSGRYPALYNLNLNAGTNLIPVALIDIHAKAEDGDATSYTRRLGGSQALKTILDGASYNSKNVILVGDFNDFLSGTSSTACSCTLSPYKNFVDDTANYTSITQNLTDVHWSRPLIEHFILSNELSDNFVAGSAAQEVAVSQNISNYFNTTSNHLPVSARFQFDFLGNTQFSINQRSWTLYPNPVKDALQFDAKGIENDAAAVYDLTGRQIFCKKINANTLDVAHLPVGTYVLKVGGRVGRFVKE